MKKKILILGPLGQDGKILSSILESDEYEIFGICKENTNTNRILFHEKNFNTKIFCGDLTKYNYVEDVLNKINPNIIVNFCGITNVFNPWDNVDEIFSQNCTIPMNILKYMTKKNNDIFFFQSSSSLMYGRSKKEHINHLSNFAPLYPYGVTKQYTHNFISEYRNNFNLKCSSGIFFNHESQYRGENFLTKKVSKFISKILNGDDGVLKLGDLSSKRDVSHALDFMFGVKHIIENNLNNDYIFSSCKLITTRDLVNLFFKKYNLKMENYVIEDLNLKRKEEPTIYGDNTKLLLSGWKQKKSLDDLIFDMVEFELNNKNFVY
jgi:GDPmannose 4,6-dehydratase